MGEPAPVPAGQDAVKRGSVVGNFGTVDAEARSLLHALKVK